MMPLFVLSPVASNRREYVGQMWATNSQMRSRRSSRLLANPLDHCYQRSPRGFPSRCIPNQCVIDTMQFAEGYYIRPSAVPVPLACEELWAGQWGERVSSDFCLAISLRDNQAQPA